MEHDLSQALGVEPGTFREDMSYAYHHGTSEPLSDSREARAFAEIAESNRQAEIEADRRAATENAEYRAGKEVNPEAAAKRGAEAEAYRTAHPVGPAPEAYTGDAEPEPEAELDL